jgi:PAS domain S-box-containing protein
MVPVLVALALLFRYSLRPILGYDAPFLILWPIVMVAAWYGGQGPGILTTLLAVIVAAFTFFDIGGPINEQGWMDMAFFVLLGLAISVLLEKLHDAQRRLAISARELFDQRERLRVTLTSIGDAVLATDVEGRITFLNPVAQALTGWTQHDAFGHPFDEVFRAINAKSGEQIESPVRKALQTGQVVGLGSHTILHSATGQKIPIDDSAAPIRDALGQVTGVVLVFRDITEQKRMLAALEEADRRKNEFLAMLGHELRNPLAPIRNALHLLRGSRTADEQTRWAREVIDRQVKQMGRLVDDLLDVSRISRGKIQFKKERMDVVGVARQALDTSRPLIEAKHHTLDIHLPAEPVWIDADPARLAQIMANLLNNAAKYTDQGGHIRFSVEPEETEVRIRVRDNGIGISCEMLPRVFDMFAQSERALERAQGGLGIGLTLVKSLVELQGGSIQAFSNGPGTGSEFIVQMPILKETGAKRTNGGAVDSSSSPVPSGVQGRRVLVVDDNIDAAESLAMLLELEGHQVRTAHDGTSALQIVRDYEPEVIFLDIGLPGMDGFEVARRLRAGEEGRPFSLVALTGFGQEHDPRSFEEAGFDAHIIKPADMNVIRRLLSHAPPKMVH